MSPQNDRGEALAAAVVALIEAFERWDIRQFRHAAAPEWKEFTRKLVALNNKVLDFSPKG